MRPTLLVVALAALAAPIAASGDLEATGRATVLAIEPGERTSFLVRLDSRSLKPVSKRLSLGGGGVCAWALSPNQRRLALDRCGDDVISLIDTRRLRPVAVISKGDQWLHHTPALAWPTQRRLVWLGADRVHAIDPLTRKTTSTAMLDGVVIQAVERVGGMIVLVAAPAGEVGAARLVVVGPDGHVRSVTLAGIRAGMTFDASSTDGEERHPGLALAPGRAFVVGAGDDPIAEIDLATMNASYHRPERRRSLLGSRVRAKMGRPGSSRYALWLGDGRLAVWGFERVRTGPGKLERRTVGLTLVDTRDWTAETLDPRAEQVALASGTLLVAAPGAGMTAYSTSGLRRYQMFRGESVWMLATFGRNLFLIPPRGRRLVVDGETGQVVARRRNLPRILHDDYHEAPIDPLP